MSALQSITLVARAKLSCIIAIEKYPRLTRISIQVFVLDSRKDS